MWTKPEKIPWMGIIFWYMWCFCRPVVLQVEVIGWFSGMKRRRREDCFSPHCKLRWRRVVRDENQTHVAANWSSFQEVVWAAQLRKWHLHISISFYLLGIHKVCPSSFLRRWILHCQVWVGKFGRINQYRRYLRAAYVHCNDSCALLTLCAFKFFTKKKKNCWDTFKHKRSLSSCCWAGKIKGPRHGIESVVCLCTCNCFKIVWKS